MTKKEFEDWTFSTWFIHPETKKVGGHPCCLTSDTKCLTRYGWKDHKDISKGDVVAAFDMKNKKMVWDEIEDIYVYNNYNNDIVDINGKSISIGMTPNHRCVTYRKTSKLKKDKYEIKNANKLSSKDCILCSADWINNTEYKQRYINKDIASLLGWFISEGNYKFNSKNKKSYCAIEITQSSSKNPKKVLDIHNLLTKNNWTFSRYDRDIKHSYNKSKTSKITTFYINDPIKEEIANLSSYPYKKIPKDILTWNIDSIEAFFESMIDGDGERISKNLLRFRQKGKEDIEMMQAIGTRLGWDSNCHEDKRNLYKITFTKKKHKLLRDSKKSLINNINYNGTVWCLRTKTYGTFVAKRNDKIFVTGNSFPEELAKRVIKLFSYRGNTVMDIFSGSGTVPYVAYSYGRNYIGIDNEEKYCNFARDRVEQVDNALFTETYVPRSERIKTDKISKNTKEGLF